MVRGLCLSKAAGKVPLSASRVSWEGRRGALRNTASKKPSRTSRTPYVSAPWSSSRGSKWFNLRRLVVELVRLPRPGVPPQKPGLDGFMGDAEGDSRELSCSSELDGITGLSGLVGAVAWPGPACRSLLSS